MNHILLIIQCINMATEKDVFSIIAADRNSPRSVLAQLISDKYHVEANEADIDDVQRLKVKFNSRYTRSKNKKSSQSLNDVVSSGSTDIIFSPPRAKQPRRLSYESACEDDDELVASQCRPADTAETPAKRPRVYEQAPFHEVGDKQRSRRSKDLFSAIRHFISSECQDQMSVNQVVGYVLDKHNRQKNKVC